MPESIHAPHPVKQPNLTRKFGPTCRPVSWPPGRVNLFERWESQAAVKAFRRRAPRNKQGAEMLSASVAEYDIADVRPLFGKGRA
jgi:hypothetical protein